MRFKSYVKYFFAIACIFASALFLSNDAIASGGINSNEIRVLSVAQGTFEYEGETYTARQNYVSQLRQYLSREDINLTAAQADKAINGIYSNVQLGVEKGYIVKVNSEKDDLDRNQKFEITEISPEEKDQGIEDIEEVRKKEKENNKPIVSEDEGKVVIVDSKGKELFNYDGILKNTGFDMSFPHIIALVLGVIILWVIISTVRIIWIERRNSSLEE